MSIASSAHSVSVHSAAPPVNTSPASTSHQTDVQGSVFKPVSQVAHAEGQKTGFKSGAVQSPLMNAVQAYGFEPDVAASLVTYGANGKLAQATNSVSDNSVPSRQDITSSISTSAPPASEASLAALGSSQSNNRNSPTEKASTNGDSIDEKAATQAIEGEKQRDRHVEEQKQEEIRVLASRDREVRAHEQSHAAIGGAYAGAPKYQFEQGPDGVSYAVGGEVPIDVGPAATPEQSLQKAQTVRRAAMAPAEPSPQDRQVAQEAVQLEAQARQEIASVRAQEAAARTQEQVVKPDEELGGGSSQTINAVHEADEVGREQGAQPSSTVESISAGLSTRVTQAYTASDTAREDFGLRASA